LRELRNLLNGVADPATTDQQWNQLLGYLTLLEHWNRTYNLTAVRNPKDMVLLHLADCLAVVAPLARVLGDRAPVELLDVGSGGGLPGVVLAVMLPQLRVTCIDAVGKKAAFIRQVAAELGLQNLVSIHGRVEQLNSPKFSVVTSRAFASLNDFVALTRQSLAPDGVWMAMKAKLAPDELGSVNADVDVFHVEHLTVPQLNADRCLVWMRPNPH
jgi:16S rRNA (guanine527-N7)-methyltransferase